ncbi:hypothetical protein AcW1_007848 [Taiwanofungus camphoratus]|nr:hypothetical protein AcW2_007094 [Antrodia cinnamomea]KAI0953693.1 hypothetical protein AcW1_007848 [Antrodia cinnamomea]
MTLQIVDQDQAQSWIAAIKQAVLSQRSARAGLGYMSHSPSGFEPRGDLDVMLSMRAQGMLSSPTSSTFSPEISGPSQSQRSASVTRSSSTAVSALRGLFTGSGSRPRSPSSASTATGDLDGDLETQHDDSFGKAGTSLLSMLRSNSVSSERPTSPALSTAPHSPSTPSTPRAESQALVLAHLDRKILQDKDMELVEARASTSNGHGNGIASLITGGSHIAAMRGFGSPSLQPPPRRRAWTSSGVPMGPRAPPDGPSYAYTHHNGSHAESFGLRQTNGSTWFSANPPASPKTTGTGSSNSHGEARPRTSTSSVSSYASASPEPRTSSDLGSSKRWSRQGTLPRRLTPPDGLPPAPPPSQSPPSYRSSMQRHPYAAETTPSRSPSVNSSPQSRGLGQQNFSKRASGSSAHSVSTVSTTHSRGGGSSHIGHHRPMSSHRTSVPPPQRPAPIAALPPTPCEGTPATKPPNSAPSAKTSLRQSLSLRTNRLSLSPPTLPPSSSLPPRPDEPGFRFHRRSTSNGSATLSPIPASPTPLVPPFPPPSGPLPPTPEAQPTSRAASIKQRLRMLSAPAPLPPPPTSPPAPPHPPSPIPSTINPYSVPSTPIGEPITTLQNDPTFLFSSPPTPPLRSPLRSPSPEPSPELNGMTSLSPPPRRGSRRISPQDEEDAQERPSTADAAGTDVNHHHMSLSLSPPSAISLVNV